MARTMTAARQASADDQGSLILATLLIMVASMFAVILVPIIVAQINTSKFDTRRAHSLDAAQAGIDTVLGMLRNAQTSGSGDLSKLPCDTSAGITGSVSAGATARYSAHIYYFSQDPRGHDDWLSNPALQISCIAGHGVAFTPAFAVIVAQGTDSPTGSFASVPTRTVQATYVFKTKNNNVPGGLIHSYNSNPDLCLDAGSSAPSAGTVVTFAACSAGSAQQMWSFNSNLTISLASTVDTTSSDLGLCLDAGAYPHAAGRTIVLRACSSTTMPQQQWGYDGSSEFFGTTSTGGADSVCLGPQSPNTVNANLVLVTCSGRDTAHSFAPDGAVGAGNADGSHKFLVNYNQFGRCLDITNQTLPQVSGTQYLISYPCKVSPALTSTPSCTPSSPIGAEKNSPTNQEWCMPQIPNGSSSASGVITSMMDSSYCLISPLSLNGNPYMDKCSNATAASKTWTVWGDTGEYTTSYRISDSSTPNGASSIGYCLQPSSNTSDVYTKIIVSTCSGSTLQKWNAPPGVMPVPVKDYHEK